MKAIPAEVDNSAVLENLRVGTPILVSLQGKTVEAKFMLVPKKLNGKFQCRVGGNIEWLQYVHFVGLPKLAPVVGASAFVGNSVDFAVVDDEVSDKANLEKWFTEPIMPMQADIEGAVVGGPIADEHLPEDLQGLGIRGGRSADGSAFRYEVDMPFAETPQAEAAGIQLIQVEPEARPAVKLAEFSAKVLSAAAEMEKEHGQVFAKALAEKMGENPKKVAGSFSPLAKAGLLVQDGEHGARFVQLTAAGWEYINPEPAPALPTEPVEVKEALPVVKFVINDECLGLLAKIARLGIYEVSDISEANILNRVEENRPELLIKTAPNSKDAYFVVSLNDAGSTLVNKLAPEWAVMPAEAAQPTPAAAEHDEAAPEPVKKKLGRPKGTKPRPARELIPEALRSKGGRPAPGQKSLRERVLDAIAKIIVAEDGKPFEITPIEASHAIAGLLQHPLNNIQNAFFKLVRSGFLVANDKGRAATPLALTEHGKTGYKANKHRSIRNDIKKLIDEGKSDAFISMELKTDIAYVKDVRTNRNGAGKMLEEAATE